MTTNEFFEAVSNLEINDLDMYNHVQAITDNFEPKKLQMLCDDFDIYVWRKLQLSDMDVNSGQSLYVSDYFIKKSNEDQKNDLKRLDDSSDDYSFDEYHDKYSYPSELKFLQRLRNLLISLTKEHIINRNLSIEDDSNKVKHPIDDYIILNSEETKSNNKNAELDSTDEPFKQSSIDISFSILNRIIHLTDYWHHADKSVIDKLLNQNTTDFVEISKQFERELKRNIVLAQSALSLRRLIKHYLFEMNELYRSENKIENLKSYRNAPNSHKEKYRSYLFTKAGDDKPTEADKFQNYILAKDEFLSIIFETLRNNIFKTGISISELREEINNSFLIDDELILELNIAKDIEDYFSSKKTSHQQKNINWLKSDDFLEQFIEALKEQDLIKTSQTENIINNHFKATRERYSKPKPIEWIYPQKNLLAYLIRELHNNRLIACQNIWQETEPHFSIDGEIVSNLRQSEDQYANRSKTGKPTNHEIIDKIISNLKH